MKSGQATAPASVLQWRAFVHVVHSIVKSTCFDLKVSVCAKKNSFFSINDRTDVGDTVLSSKENEVVSSLENTNTNSEELENKETDIDYWAYCLLKIPSGNLSLYQGVERYLVLLAAFINQRHVKHHINGTSPLCIFLTRPEVVRLLEQHLFGTGGTSLTASDAGAMGTGRGTASNGNFAPSRILTAIEWSAVVTMFYIGGISSVPGTLPSATTVSTFDLGLLQGKIATACAVSLSHLLERTPTVWHASTLDAGVRSEVEDIFQVLHGICPGLISTNIITGATIQPRLVPDARSIVVYCALQDARCKETLLKISQRVEDGYVMAQGHVAAQEPSAGLTTSELEDDGSGMGEPEELHHASVDTTAAVNEYNNEALGGTRRNLSAMHCLTNRFDATSSGHSSSSRRIDVVRQQRLQARLQNQRQHQSELEFRMGFHRTQWCEIVLTAAMKLYVWMQDMSMSQAGGPSGVVPNNTESEKAKDKNKNSNKSVKSAIAGGLNDKFSASAAISAPTVEASVLPQHSSQALQEGILMLQSPCWQRRILGLVTLEHIMRLETLAAVGITNGSTPVLPAQTRAESVPTASAKARKPDIITPSGANAKKVKNNAVIESPIATSADAIIAKQGIVRRQRNAGRPVEELCKGGHIRTLCWNLLSKRGSIRLHTSQLLEHIMVLAERDEVGTLVWAAFVEQGLVPLLETIACGLSVRAFVATTASDAALMHPPLSAIPTIPTLFPETSVRRTALSLLLCLASHLHQSHAHTPNTSVPTTSFLLLQQRLSSALLHSGNKTLRMNIFIGMLFLSARHTGLARTLWNIRGSLIGKDSLQILQGSNHYSEVERKNENILDPGRISDADSNVNGGNGGMFLQMLQALQKDRSELTSILRIVAHVIHVAAACGTKELVTVGDKDLPALVPPLPQSLHSSRNTAVLPTTQDPGIGAKYGPSYRLQTGCTVLVDNEGQLTRMQCPSLSVIHHHCPGLAAILSKSEEALSKYVATRDVMSTPYSSQSQGQAPAPELPVLAGDYALWQEIFSHMLDADQSTEFLQPSLHKMSTLRVVSAFHIARRFHMIPLLEKYANALALRVDSDTLVPILAAAMGWEEDERTGVRKYSVRLDPSKQGISGVDGHVVSSSHPACVLMHARLTSTCLQFFEKNLDRLFFGGLLNTSSAATSRQMQAQAQNQVRQMELLELLHCVLGVIFDATLSI